MSCRIALRTGCMVLAVLLVASGCAVVGPQYTAPKLSKTDVPAQWTTEANAAAGLSVAEADARTVSSWWSELDDAALDQLVANAFETSPTLDAAVAKLRQSQSAYAQTDASSRPSVDGSVAGAVSSDDSGKTTARDSWLSMNSSWEIDLFGAVRRGKEGALAREEAQLATLADARVSLAADVTDAYLNYRACQSDLALGEQDVTSRIATEQLTANSVEVGFTAPYQGIRSKASVAEARTSLASTRERCGRLENLLTRLTGVVRPSLMRILADKPTGLQRLPEPKHFSVAIPSQALMQRPDIRAAERTLAAASADIGLAEADRYPRLALNGALGYEVNGSSSGGSVSFGSWSFGPTLSLPIFDAGRRAAEVQIATSRYDEALATYKSKARRAIQEVEDALTRYAAAHERAEHARVAANQYQHFFKVVEQRYREGASNLLELEDARRSMLDAERTQLGVQQERLQAWVALNRATGGAAQYEPKAAASPAKLDSAAPAQTSTP